jgi:RHS repeat-associated protein
MVSVVEPGGDGTREKFTGKEFDEEGAVDSVTQGIQAYHFPVRMYDPEIGLWMRPDPARQFFNSYAYAGNGYNPVRFIDPIGLELRLYFTPANKLGGYHVFVWSTELQQGRGRNGSSGWTIDQGYEQKDIDDPGSNGGKYIVIEDLNGMTEEEAFDKINRYPGWNEGGFMFFLDDCHNQMEEAFEYAGLHYPTESEGNPGRFESANKNWEAVAGVFVNLIFRPLFGPWGILLGNGRIYDAESYVVLDATYRNSGNGNVRTNQAPGVRIKNRETEDEFNPTGQKY